MSQPFYPSVLSLARMRIECPKCHAAMESDTPDEALRQKFYLRRSGGSHYWVCLECTRAFHAPTGTIVS